MKVIFRSNDQLAKKELGQLGGAEEWLHQLDKFLSESAVARLSLFIDNGISLATLDIIDQNKHIHSSYKDANPLTALESVIKKCHVQLKKSKYEFKNDSLRQVDGFDSMDESVILVPDTIENFELLHLENKLANEKKTPKYQRTMDKYIDYLYRKNDLERADEHLRILYSIYTNVDKEKVSVADFERLIQSINQITDDILLMMEKQEKFENNKRDNSYINKIIDDEARLAKLKK